MGHCAAVGARLCTLNELKAEAAKYTGCDFDKTMVWTQDPCVSSSGEPGLKVARGKNGTNVMCQVATATANL
eukprot:scaffold24431_cov43-Prasinocladus_malaysianus.AAC.1